jgi:hypothetical protein
MPAAATNFAIGGRAATTGFGGDLTMRMTSWLNVRASANMFGYAYSDTYDGVSYDAELDLQSAGVLADFHPFHGSFRVSVGAYANGNGIDFTGQPTQNVNIGGQSFTPAQVGTINGTVAFQEYAPYLGIGWGNAVGERKQLGFSLEVGVLFQGAPDVEMVSQGGLLSNDPTLISEMESEEQAIESDLSGMEYYPVVAMGVSWAF